MNKRQKKKTRFRGENDTYRNLHKGYDIGDLAERLNVNPQKIFRQQDRYHRYITRQFFYIIGYKSHIFKDKYWKYERSRTYRDLDLVEEVKDNE